MSKNDKPYLPKVRTDYHPSDKECRKYSLSDDVVEKIPNPAVDPIVANNIACQEFDYTQDMMSATDIGLSSKDSKKF